MCLNNKTENYGTSDKMQLWLYIILNDGSIS